MSAVTNVIYIPDTPFGPGNDWTLIVVAPPTGSGQVSFDNGATWITSSTYNSTYAGFELRCQDGVGSQWGQGGCMPINGSGYGVIRARKQGESDYKLVTLGQGEQTVGGDGFSYAYAAFCTGANIVITFTSQYGATGPNNYQLAQDKTQRITLSLDGINIAPVAEYSDGCHVSTCHWTRVFATQSIPVGNFPLVAIFGDSTSTVPSWSVNISVGNIGNPCSSTITPAPTPVAPPTASATPDELTAVTNVQKVFNLAANDTPCSSGAMMYAILASAANGTATLNSAGSLTYKSNSTFVGVDTLDYGIFCDGALRSRARVKITVSSGDPCYGQSLCAQWVNTGVTDCENGLEITRYMNVNNCADVVDNFEWRVTGRCRKKVPCPPDKPCH